MELAVDLLRSSLEPVRRRGHLFTHTFYDRLLARQPEIQSLVGSRFLGEHHASLLREVTMTVRNLEKREAVEAHLRELGERLRRLGLEPRHFEVAGECLLESLRVISDEAWTQETEAAWRHACRYALDHMLRRTDKVLA